MVKKKNILGTSVITQIGIVVHDIEKTSQAFTEFFNVKKPSWSRTAPRKKTNAEYRGNPTEARAKLAFFRFKNIALELIEPDEHPSTWREFLDEKGEGVHHIAFGVKDRKAKYSLMEEKGFNIAQKGDFTGGHYAYIDTDRYKLDKLGHSSKLSTVAISETDKGIS